MPRGRDRRRDYLRDRASRRGRRSERRDREYMPMDYRYDYAERGRGRGSSSRRDRNMGEERYMEYEQPRERYGDYGYDMRYDYRGRDRGYDYRGRDYAEDDENEKEYHEDLMEWVEKLKKYDRYGLSKEQVISKGKEMGVDFKDFEEDEFYAIYLMQVSDYPFVANEPHTYLAMAKAWLDDKDLEIEPSEKVCKYLYEIVMADEE